jgi:hypothetical protein
VPYHQYQIPIVPCSVPPISVGCRRSRSSALQIAHDGRSSRWTRKCLLRQISVLKNVALPKSMPKKKHKAICYHKASEVQAAGVIRIAWESTETNLADMLTKCPAGPRPRALSRRVLYYSRIGDIRPCMWYLHRFLFPRWLFIRNSFFILRFTFVHNSRLTEVTTAYLEGTE